MQETILMAEIRQHKTSNENKVLRRNDMIPGIYYHRGSANLEIAVKSLNLIKLAKSVTTQIISLTLPDNTQYKSILKNVQWDPVTDIPIHFDLIGIKDDELMLIDIPVVLEGTSLGQRDGGIIQFMLRKVRVECLPKDMPEHIVIDITNMNIGDSSHIRDLKLENVHIRENEDSQIVSIVPPTVEVAKATEAVEGAVGEEAKAEPEVVPTKGKKEEEKS
jgi:large subunit ribosomal protein L25